MTFSLHELESLMEALVKAASRHESQARAAPRSAGEHDRKAADMRKLRGRIMKLKTELGAA
jgi:hypothetical protein